MAALFWNNEVRILSKATENIDELKRVIENELRQSGFLDVRRNNLEVAGGRNSVWLSIAHFQIEGRRFWEVVMASGDSFDVTQATVGEVVDKLHGLPQPTGQRDKYSLWSSATTLRGANLYQRSRIEIYDGEPGDPFVPSYDADIFSQLRSAGANVVFLSIPAPFMVEPPYTVDADAVGLLDDLVNKAEAAGLFVVLAFRTSPGRNENDILNFLPVPVVRSLHKLSHPSQQAFVQMWRFVADRFSDRATVVGYDLLVEPHTNTDGTEDEDDFRKNWRDLCQQTIAAIREVDADTPILIQPSSWASPAALSVWQMPAGDRLVCSVHQYEPFNYIQDENGAGQLPFDFSKTQAAYREIANFQVSFPNIPVAVTEFGVKNTCLNGGDFLQRQLDAIEERTCNHAVWAWGDDSGNFDVRDASLFATVTANWAKNTVFR
jgi:Cellulase (glycosyl hydrolase family 5)